MAEKVLAAVKTGVETTELREFDMPDVPEDGAIAKMEIAGICGSDVKNYKKPIENVIMGHENVAMIWKAGKKFVERKGVKEGDRVLLEHYLPCMRCEWCHLGEYRHCHHHRLAHKSGRHPLWLYFRRYQTASMGRVFAISFPPLECCGP